MSALEKIEMYATLIESERETIRQSLERIREYAEKLRNATEEASQESIGA